MEAKVINANRTDPHRPGAIIPSDYGFVIAFGTMPTDLPGQPPIHFNVDRVLAMAKGNEPFFVHPAGRRGIFQCDICGAHYNHGEVWRYLPTGELITLGMDCAEKYSLFGDRAEWTRWHAEQTRLRSLAAKDKRFKKAAHSFLELHPGLAEVLALADRLKTHGPERDADGNVLRPYTRDEAKEQWKLETIADMRYKLNRWGSLSDAQIRFATKLAGELTNPEPKVEEKHVAAPEGRRSFRGEVVAVKYSEGPWGSTRKLVVKVTEAEGTWLVWVTEPGVLSAERGSIVEMTATLTRGRDEHFAFGKRPTGAKVIEEAK